jgi:hypothetical protein
MSRWGRAALPGRRGTARSDVTTDTGTAASGDGAAELGKAARQAAHSTGLRRIAQLGLVGYALIHVLVAWLAVQLAWHVGSGTRSGRRAADQAGALALLARSSAGDVLLWVLGAGMAGLCLWQAVEVVRHHRRLPPPGRRRAALLQLAKTVGTAVLYGFLAVSAVRTALGGGQSRGREQSTVGGVLSWPGGPVLVFAVGLVVIGIGVYMTGKGLRSDFLDEIDLDTVAPALRPLAHRTGQAGFALKGVALVVVGVVVCWAAVRTDPRHGDGLDGALRVLAAQSYGPWALTLVAAGLVAFAGYCLIRARHPVG